MVFRFINIPYLQQSIYNSTRKEKEKEEKGGKHRSRTSHLASGLGAESGDGAIEEGLGEAVRERGAGGTEDVVAVACVGGKWRGGGGGGGRGERGDRRGPRGRDHAKATGARKGCIS